MNKGLYFSDSCHRCGDNNMPCHLVVQGAPNGGVGLCVQVFTPYWYWADKTPIVHKGYAIHLGDAKWMGIPVESVAAYYGTYAHVVEWLQNEAGIDPLDHTAINCFN